MARSKLKNKITLVVMIIILVLGIAYFAADYFGVTFPWEVDKSVSGGTIEVHMIDVGQGDCILVRAPEGNMLIDSGDLSKKSKAAIKTYLQDLQIKDFEYVVFTHSDADHIGSADYIMENYDVENVIISNDVRDGATYKRMMAAIEASDAEVIDAVPNATYSIGEMSIKILGPMSAKYTDENDYSVVLRIDFGESSFLMTGDAEKKSEAEMVEEYVRGELDCDVLKAGHHGSGTSSSLDFLKLVTPEVVMISCGEGNSYGHPHASALERFRIYMKESEIYRTDKLGDIVFVSDGEIIKCGNTVLVDESN
ncbi:MAG: MBL fold metallo-hydrolase [Ruminococcaceae bacterium]|nr:MBL fold metallo-hydrolase [Oscillospiraceae bacterium]